MRGVLAGNEVVVVCGGAEHVIRWVGGSSSLELLGHPGARSDDDVLVALSGEPARCRAIERAWDCLSRSSAELLLSATPSQLAAMAARGRFTAEQRAKVARRDDLSEPERRRLLRAFEERLFAAEVAGPRWRRALRHRMGRFTPR